jgi:hypothetical protein
MVHPNPIRRLYEWIDKRLSPGKLIAGDRRKTPAVLVSFIVHVAVLLLLAVITIKQRVSATRGFNFTAAFADIDSDVNSATPMLMAGDDSPPPLPITDQQPISPPRASADSLSKISDLLISETLPSPPADLVSSISELLEATANSPSATFAATGIEGRSLENRRELALARGGSLESEKAVESALDWLAAHQMANGGWSLIHDSGACQGRCANNGVPDRFDPAATGLSLLAFLGAGYTHRNGKHRETVRKGIYFLLQILEETPQGGSFLYQSERGMYNHGIAAFALCEAYQLSQDPELRRAAQQAVNFIDHAQNYQGGWGYLPKQPGDLTLSGWQIMALKSAFAAKLDIPSNTILLIDPFLDTQQAPSGIHYGYGKPGTSPTCTAIGQLIRLFRGMSHTDPRVLAGASYLQKLGRSNGDAYYNYYSTLFLFHVGEPFWREWNATMREHLVATQSQSGHETGSWYFENVYGREGGRLYTTAMCAMTLEVYYRFSPLYQQAEVPFEL